MEPSLAAGLTRDQFLSQGHLLSSATIAGLFARKY
jgi:hypothetical protein